MQISYKHICKITIPVLVSLLMEYLIGFTDTAYLGRVGETELAASALAGTYYMIIYMIGFGFSIGAQILIARYNGSRQYSLTGEVFTQGTIFLLLVATLLFTLSYLYSPVVLSFLIDSEQVYLATIKIGRASCRERVYLWILFFVHYRNVQSFFYWNCQYKDSYH